MKVNYPERIDLSLGELKIILSEQRTIAGACHFCSEQLYSCRFSLITN